jgi:CHAD domain-containing protein
MSEPARPRTVLVPVSARPPLIDAEVPAGEALRVILFEALAQVNANVPVVTEARDSEGLHQLRVGLRRLRTALTLTDSPELAALDIRAKAIIAQVGPARDLDVFVTDLFGPAVKDLGSRRGFDILAARAELRREKAWQSAIETVSRPDFRAFDEDVAAAARAITWPDGTTVAALAPQLLDSALRRAKKRGRHFQDLDPPSRHRLRIALKKLRYAAEFLAPLYPKKTVKHWLAPLKELQDLLGHLNDVAEVRGVVGHLLLEEAQSAGVQADLSYAAGLLQGFHQARSETIARIAHKQWKAFRQTPAFWV